MLQDEEIVVVQLAPPGSSLRWPLEDLPSLGST